MMKRTKPSGNLKEFKLGRKKMNNFKVGEEGDKTSDRLWTLQELQGTAINLVGENVTSQHNGLLRTVQAGQDTDFLGLAERQLTVKNTGDREQQ